MVSRCTRPDSGLQRTGTGHPLKDRVLCLLTQEYRETRTAEYESWGRILGALHCLTAATSLVLLEALIVNDRSASPSRALNVRLWLVRLSAG